MDERERSVEIHANAIFELLREYAPHDRVFALAEIVRLVQRRLSSRESTRHQLDFTVDERPTDPVVPPTDIGDRVTRRLSIDEINVQRKKGRY